MRKEYINSGNVLVLTGSEAKDYINLEDSFILLGKNVEEEYLENNQFEKIIPKNNNENLMEENLPEIKRILNELKFDKKEAQINYLINKKISKMNKLKWKKLLISMTL